MKKVGLLSAGKVPASGLGGCFLQGKSWCNHKKRVFFFFFKLYNIVLVLPNIEMNLPQVRTSGWGVPRG